MGLCNTHALRPSLGGEPRLRIGQDLAGRLGLDGEADGGAVIAPLKLDMEMAERLRVQAEAKRAVTGAGRSNVSGEPGEPLAVAKQIEPALERELGRAG